MVRRRGGVSRREFGEKVDRSKTALDGKESELKVYTSDLEQERRTLESLDLDGAEEDSRQVEEAISRAEKVTAERFDGENRQLEQLQDENQGLEGDFQDRRETTESDLRKMSGARLESSEAVSAMVGAKEAALRGKEFLSEQADRIRRTREASEQAQRALEARVRAIRGGR